MEQFLRQWRQDALNKNQYESAIFIGDKLLALTSAPSSAASSESTLMLERNAEDDKDAFWLAQIHFHVGNYSRALSLLAPLVANNASCKYLAGHCYIKQGKFDEALGVLGQRDPVHLVAALGRARRKLHHSADASDASELRRDRMDPSEERDKEDAANIRYEAAMCYLRGVCYAKQNAFDRAKECYKHAVRIDVQCFEALDQLMRNSLLSSVEQYEFLELLDFDSIAAGSPSASHEAAEFVKMLYITRLSKYEHIAEFTAATESLSTHYRLAENPDILLARAELLYTQCRFKDALALTAMIVAQDRYNFNAIPLHLAVLFELQEANALFLLAHDLVDNHPSEPTAWFAVGVYYLCILRVAEARRFFSKASMMDPHFGPAWIGFAHTFAAEGEHDQAISAYSTAARLFQGTHLPQLFLGMQNLQLSNVQLAFQYLRTAYSLCKQDPLLLNEMGVAAYHDYDNADSFPLAVDYFRMALTMAAHVDCDPRAWTATRANLGYALRRSGKLKEALSCFNEVLRVGGKDGTVMCAKGMTMLQLGMHFEALTVLHEALAVMPQDPIAADLLNMALDVHGGGLFLERGEEGVESKLSFHKAQASQARQLARRRRAQRARLTSGAGPPRVHAVDSAADSASDANRMDVDEL